MKIGIFGGAFNPPHKMHKEIAIELLNKYGFKSNVLKYNTDDMLDLMKKDKKAQQDNIVLIVPCDKKRVKEIKISTDETRDLF